jgi:molybdopterin molybdotransferase
LAALVRRVGGIPKIYPLVPDTLGETRQALANSLEKSDILVTSGGVSVGDLDFIKPALQDAGGKIAFWKVAIRPGRPFVFGCCGRKLIFGLPGNPVSAFVTFLLLVRPAILRFQGATDVRLPSHTGVLLEAINNPGDRRHFVRVIVDELSQVTSAGVQASHTLFSLARANALLDLPPHSSLAAGATVQILRFE